MHLALVAQALKATACYRRPAAFGPVTLDAGRAAHTKKPARGGFLGDAGGRGRTPWS